MYAFRAWRPPCALAVLTAIAASVAGPGAPVARAAGPLRDEAYVWQRSWGDGVSASVRTQAPEFARLVVLGAEIAWRDGRPDVARAETDLAACAAGEAPGIALRVGSWPGPFDGTSDATRCVVATAVRLLDDARSRGVTPSELQIDFDCATSKLPGYRRWIEILRREAAPTPVTFTALPTWLRSDDFPGLAQASDGFVLQVHSLEAPRGSGDVRALVDPARAVRDVERAAAVGVPFLVALPTYGYVAAFRRDGSLAGISAEAEPRAWPRGSTTVDVSADPDAIASLVRGWTADRPEFLRGAIWYRLPMPGDRRNWTADALRSVRRGKVPRAEVVSTVERRDPALAEVRVRNSGRIDGATPAAIDVRWTGARLIASDAFAGFVASDVGERRVLLRPAAGARVAAGSDRLVAWLRFDGAAEVTVDAVH
ncbi:MAG: DUF3142 domain-containing protein [Planctomycetes bacterium]|nr:DUF3142 domain-containing protein [Planctomycetota bacterium]